MKQEWFDKLIKTGKDIQVTIYVQEAYDELTDICDRVGDSCDYSCPVYKRCMEQGEFTESYSGECPYMRNGKKMFERLRL